MTFEKERTVIMLKLKLASVFVASISIIATPIQAPTTTVPTEVCTNMRIETTFNRVDYKQFYHGIVTKVEEADQNNTTDNNNQPDTYTPSYSQSNLDLLARVITAEAGSEWLSDELQLYTGQVVLNRVKSDKYPNTIHDVIYQKGQYQCVKNGAINKQPSKRAIVNAKRLLNGERFLPDKVTFQSEFRQGKHVYKTYYDDVLNSTTYFCY